MSKYRFDPQRCHDACSMIAEIAESAGLRDKDSYLLADALGDLILDIESLHERAQERDHVLEAMMDAIQPDEKGWGYSADAEELRRIYHCYTDESGVLQHTADLDL